LSSLYLYNAKETSSVSLGDTSIADVKGGIVLDAAHSEFGNLFLDVSDGSAKTDHLISLGHEVYESTTLFGGGVNDDKQELFADNFGNRLSTRLDQAAGGNLDTTGGRSFNTSLLNSQSVQLGTLHANTVGNTLVDHRQLGGKELTAIKNMAPDYAKKKGVSLEQARKELTQQALRMVDKTWSEQAHIEENTDARNFLLTNSEGQSFVIGGHLGGLVGGETTSLFTSNEEQFNDKYLLANEATDNELGKFRAPQSPYEVTPLMLSDYDLRGWLERYATADGTRPVELKDVSAGDYAEQVGKDSVVAGTFLGKQVTKTQPEIAIDLLEGAYKLAGKAMGACQQEGASCLLPSTDTHGSAGDKANIDSLTGNKDAFIRNSTFAGYSTAFDLANVALMAYPFGAGAKAVEVSAGELLLVNETKVASNKLGDLSPGVLAEGDFGYLNQRAKNLVEDATNSAELRGSPDFYVGPAGPESTLQGTGYRYMRLYNDDGTVNKYALVTLDTNAAPVTYFGFEKFESGAAARDAFQIKGPELGDSWSDARLVGTFDTLQIFDAKGTPTVRHPYFAGDDISTGKIEPFTEAYPQYGKGGVEQLTADRQEIKFNKLDILPAELKPDTKAAIPTLLNLRGDTALGGIRDVRVGETVELFTDARGVQIPGAKGVGPNDFSAVAIDARNMPNIASNSQVKVVASNPYIPKSAGGNFTMMDYLPEATRITQPGGEIVINGTAANKYLTNLPTQAQLDVLGLEVKYQGTLLPEYQGQTYLRADGSKLTEPMQSIVFRKKK
ncbi:MAG TPA: hypothetical protein PK011_09945, partial [Marinagarivorans sp.]|nr:hypothetical protein [Marinagarivorans sp.]